MDMKLKEIQTIYSELNALHLEFIKNNNISEQSTITKDHLNTLQKQLLTRKKQKINDELLARLSCSEYRIEQDYYQHLCHKAKVLAKRHDLNTITKY